MWSDLNGTTKPFGLESGCTRKKLARIHCATLDEARAALSISGGTGTRRTALLIV
jgi:hypothetical protein